MYAGSKRRECTFRKSEPRNSNHRVLTRVAPCGGGARRPLPGVQPAPAHDPLAPARGIFIGLVLGAACWFVIVAVLREVLS